MPEDIVSQEEIIVENTGYGSYVSLSKEEQIEHDYKSSRRIERMLDCFLKYRFVELRKYD